MDYTQELGQEHIDPSLTKVFAVGRVHFVDTETWVKQEKYKLPRQKTPLVRAGSSIWGRNGDGYTKYSAPTAVSAATVTSAAAVSTARMSTTA